MSYRRNGNVVSFHLGSSWKNQSISHGTMIEEDIVDAIERFAAYSTQLTNAIAEFRAAKKDSEDRSMILNEVIWDIMDGLAPTDCYFGAHPGDGSDFGFWEVEHDR